MTDKKLENFRKQIDIIDDKIFSLLDQRFDIVKQVGEWKKENGDDCIIRSDREAVMVKDIYNKAKEKGYENKIALAFANFWRNIIATSINLEEETIIAIPNVVSKDIRAVIYNYFGIFSEYKKFKNNENTLNSVIEGDSTIACCNFSEEKNKWWNILADHNNNNQDNKIMIFASLPYFTSETMQVDENKKVFCIAKLEPAEANLEGKNRYLYRINREIVDSNDNIKGDIKIISISKDRVLARSSEKLNIEADYLGNYAVW
jgi:chorismate mutase